MVSHFVTESLTKFDPATVSISDGDTSGSSTSEPTSILRRRKPTEGKSFIWLKLADRIFHSVRYNRFGWSVMHLQDTCKVLLWFEKSL